MIRSHFPPEGIWWSWVWPKDQNLAQAEGYFWVNKGFSGYVEPEWQNSRLEGSQMHGQSSPWDTCWTLRLHRRLKSLVWKFLKSRVKYLIVFWCLGNKESSREEAPKQNRQGMKSLEGVVNWLTGTFHLGHLLTLGASRGQKSRPDLWQKTIPVKQRSQQKFWLLGGWNNEIGDLRSLRYITDLVFKTFATFEAVWSRKIKN